MSLVCIASQEGSPGATTTALLLAGLWPKSPKRKVFLEADPRGGSIAAIYHLSLDPDLATLATAVDSGISPKRLWRHTQLLPGSTEAVVSSPKSDDVARILEVDGSNLGRWLNELGDIDIFGDVGRFDLASPSQNLVVCASSVLMVARPVSDQLRLGAERMSELQDSVEHVSWVLIGDAPYSAKEVEAAYGFPVMAVLADDSQTALSLEEGSSVSHLAQAPLVQTARKLVEALQDQLVASQAAHAVSETLKQTKKSISDERDVAVAQPSPLPTKPAPAFVSLLDEDNDQTIIASGPGTIDPTLLSGPGTIDPWLLPPSLLPPSLLPPSLLPPALSGTATIDPALVPPSLLPPVLSGAGTVDPALVPPSTASPFEVSATLGDQPVISGDIDLVSEDQPGSTGSEPFAVFPLTSLETELGDDGVNGEGVVSEMPATSSHKTMEPMPGREFWDVTTRLAAPPVPLRFSVAQDRIPMKSSKAPTKPPPPVVPPSKRTGGTEEKDRPTITDLPPVDPPKLEAVTSAPAGRDMPITEVIQAIGTPTGENDVPPSLLPATDVTDDKTPIGGDFEFDLEQPEGRPPSLLDGKLSTSANPAENIPGYPPID